VWCRRNRTARQALGTEAPGHMRLHCWERLSGPVRGPVRPSSAEGGAGWLRVCVCACVWVVNERGRANAAPHGGQHPGWWW